MGKHAAPERTFLLITFALLVLSATLPPTEAVVLGNRFNSPLSDWVFINMTNLGHGLILIPFLALLCFKRIYFSLGLLLAGVVQGLVVLVCKRLLFADAGRPITIVDNTKLHFVPGVEVHRAMSFPSGHTVTIFGLCVFVALCYKSKPVTLLAAAIACLVGYSRLYLLQHFLTDIAAGALIGTITGIWGFYFMERVNKPDWMKYSVEINIKDKGSRPSF